MEGSTETGLAGARLRVKAEMWRRKRGILRAVSLACFSLLLLHAPLSARPVFAGDAGAKETIRAAENRAPPSPSLLVEAPSAIADESQRTAFSKAAGNAEGAEESSAAEEKPHISPDKEAPASSGRLHKTPAEKTDAKENEEVQGVERKGKGDDAQEKPHTAESPSARLSAEGEKAEDSPTQTREGVDSENEKKPAIETERSKSREERKDQPQERADVGQTEREENRDKEMENDVTAGRSAPNSQYPGTKNEFMGDNRDSNESFGKDHVKRDDASHDDHVRDGQPDEDEYDEDDSDEDDSDEDDSDGDDSDEDVSDEDDYEEDDSEEYNSDEDDSEEVDPHDDDSEDDPNEESTFDGYVDYDDAGDEDQAQNDLDYGSPSPDPNTLNEAKHGTITSGGSRESDEEAKETHVEEEQKDKLHSTGTTGGSMATRVAKTEEREAPEKDGSSHDEASDQRKEGDGKPEGGTGEKNRAKSSSDRGEQEEEQATGELVEPTLRTNSLYILYTYIYGEEQRDSVLSHLRDCWCREGRLSRKLRFLPAGFLKEDLRFLLYPLTCLPRRWYPRTAHLMTKSHLPYAFVFLAFLLFVQKSKTSPSVHTSRIGDSPGFPFLADAQVNDLLADLFEITNRTSMHWWPGILRHFLRRPAPGFVFPMVPEAAGPFVIPPYMHPAIPADFFSSYFAPEDGDFPPGLAVAPVGQSPFDALEERRGTEDEITERTSRWAERREGRREATGHFEASPGQKDDPREEMERNKERGETEVADSAVRRDAELATSQGLENVEDGESPKSDLDVSPLQRHHRPRPPHYYYPVYPVPVYPIPTYPSPVPGRPYPPSYRVPYPSTPSPMPLHPLPPQYPPSYGYPSLPPRDDEWEFGEEV
uniref:SDRF_STAEP Serine-aspartate repeat-conta n=1 Tax=Neospora caninum (strain Liverpool) TaxID=572307 RepID=A0A0F7U7I0_NEOCL|nr:TPA: SDRF_STAEP Serine-aspartate repeat-conta [Neospora caninum Liverpool]